MASQDASREMTQSRLVVSGIEFMSIGLEEDNKGKSKEQLYVTVSFEGKREKTSFGQCDHNESESCTKWKESLEFDIGKDQLRFGDFVLIEVLKSATIFSKLLGKTKLPVTDVLNREGTEIPFKVNLRDGDNNPIEAVLQCSLQYISPQNQKTPSVSSQVTNTVDSRLRSREQVTQKKIPYPEKPRDFQVRVKVIEGRHIVGRNINPVVRVTVGAIKKQTRVKHITNQPFYNQTFSFNFNTKFLELFEQEIKFEVFDSRRLRHDSLIGFYKCDVREVYNFEGHIVLRKWIVLAEPQQSKKIIEGGNVVRKNNLRHGVGGEAVGFLKVSMFILEAGMSSTPPLDNLAGSSEKDDIESNLLHLPGVSLIPTVFTLKVFKAVDIPQMDHDSLLNRLRAHKKECADPYCIFSFAGKQATSSIKYASRSPVFNEKLNISFKYPSVCDKIKIQLMDWDFGTLDDYIGTIYLPISQLCGQGGNEYSPTFGPCFVNMYGSPREYSDWPNKYEDLDKGIGEGAAYRGRVLVHLETAKHATNEVEVEKIERADVSNIQPFMRTKKFRLLAVFLEATMLAIEDTQVEFELSIGNYGNKLDDSVSPRPSSTAPMNPLFDGQKYYYLPWGNSKPYVSIECEWEDICFRLGALNQLLRTCRDLKQSINQLKCTTPEKIEDCVHETLDRLIENCKSLPKLTPDQQYRMTILDQRMNETRLELLASVVAKCEELRSNGDGKLILKDLEELLKRIESIAFEPQNSIPDVIIWMIKAERTRVAYCRIPVHELLYMDDESERGINCGKTIDINLKYPGKKDSAHKSKFAGMLRLMIWFGRQEHEGKWSELERTGGKRTIYAETYENQTRRFFTWSSHNLSRPAFSNADGTIELPKEKFQAPEGWNFVGDKWEVHSEPSTKLRKDSGCKIFLDHVFENEYRLIPGGVWKKHDSHVWTDRFGNLMLDEQGNSIKDKAFINPPDGWEWSQRDWITDPDRASDSNGWEYTTEASYGQADYESTERTFHFFRRRRWIKQRKIVTGQRPRDSVDSSRKDKGWEYAMTFKSEFHTEKKWRYNVRRKRLRRQLFGKATAADPVFILQIDGKEKDDILLVPPSIVLSFKEPILCQLRAHLFQGRNLLPSDPDGLADPFVRLSFGCRSAMSKTINKKLNPTWDQMLVLESVPIYGHPNQIVENPPDVVMELFDRDRMGQNEYLGRVQVEPLVLQAGQDTSERRLSWFGVYKGSSRCGDVLAAFELYLDENNSAPALPKPDNKGNYPIPLDIRPRTQRTAVEVFCWGLRSLRRYHWMKVRSPSVEIEIANDVKKKCALEAVNGNSNFDGDRVLCFDVNLPRDAIYLPAITIQLKTSRSQSPIGICVVENLRKFQRNEEDYHVLFNEMFTEPEIGTLSSGSDSETLTVVVDSGPESSQQSRGMSIVDWWGKYDAVKHGKDKYPKIYPHSLEKEFNNFQDNIRTFYFRRGKMETSDEDDENSIVGEFKGALATYDLADDFSGPLRPRIFNKNRLRRFDSVSCIVRVYVVKASDLVPKDRNGLSDPYLVVSLGDDILHTKENYKAETLEAEFGNLFQFEAIIPEVKELKVQVKDYDYGNDDLIGETVVDLENRLLSQRHATAGLPPTYDIQGPNKWKFGSKYIPSLILETYCEDLGIEQNFENGDRGLILTRGKEIRYFQIKDFEKRNTDLTNAGPIKERLSLHVLNSLKGEHKLVPEHIETRTLTNELYPGFPQGKLEMFVDIFPKTYGSPGPAIDIAPPKPKHYELRVIVWNTKDVQPQDVNIYGDEMSDIFVKCRMTGIDDVQKTDTHYRSLNGDGMFNYRMVFPFEYSEIKRSVIVMKKANFFSRRKYTEEIEPQLVVEIWDNDLFSLNDFIGQVEIDLKRIPKPYGRPKEIKDWPLSKETNSLFEKVRVRGWWPVAGKPKKKDKKKNKIAKSVERVLTGKVELTLELVEEEDAKARPVGKGQSDPNRHPVLDKPKRPATSFLWILNPWKSFRYVVWSHFKWYFILGIILILIVLLFALFIYSAPGYSVKKLFNT